MNLKRVLFKLGFLYPRVYACFCYYRKKARRREIEEKFTFYFPDRWDRRGLRKAVKHIFELRGARKVVRYLMPQVDGWAARAFFTAEGFCHIDREREKGRGIVLVSGHIGDPQLGFPVLKRMGYDFILIKGGPPLKPDPRTYHYTETEKDTIFIYDPAKAAEYKERILAILRSGGIVHYYADTREGGRKERVPFLGREMEFPTGMIHLARVADAAFIPFAQRYHRGRVTMKVEEPLDRGWPAGEADYRRVLAGFVRFLEREFTDEPEQFMGIYGPTVVGEYPLLHGLKARSGDAKGSSLTDTAQGENDEG
jgi:lauroyl/myristoyl acyltransferase